MRAGISSMCSLQHRREVEARSRCTPGPPTAASTSGKNSAVGAALVEVVLPGAHVGEAGRHAALRAGPALGGGVLLERVVDAPVLVGVDDAGERRAPAAVDDDVGVLGRDVGSSRTNVPSADADVQLLAVLGPGVGADDGDVLDEGLQACSCGLPRMGPRGRGRHGWTCRRRARRPGRRGRGRAAGRCRRGSRRRRARRCPAAAPPEAYRPGIGRSSWSSTRACPSTTQPALGVEERRADLDRLVRRCQRRLPEGPAEPVVAARPGQRRRRRQLLGQRVGRQAGRRGERRRRRRRQASAPESTVSRKSGRPGRRRGSARRARSSRSRRAARATTVGVLGVAGRLVAEPPAGGVDQEAAVHHGRPAGQRRGRAGPGRRGPGRRRGSRWRRRAARRSAARRRASRRCRGRPRRRSPAGARRTRSGSAPKPLVASSTARHGISSRPSGRLDDDPRDAVVVDEHVDQRGRHHQVDPVLAAHPADQVVEQHAPRPAPARCGSGDRVAGVVEVGDEREVEPEVVGEPLDQPRAHVDQGAGDPLVGVARRSWPGCRRGTGRASRRSRPPRWNRLPAPGTIAVDIEVLLPAAKCSCRSTTSTSRPSWAAAARPRGRRRRRRRRGRGRRARSRRAPPTPIRPQRVARSGRPPGPATPRRPDVDGRAAVERRRRRPRSASTAPPARRPAGVVGDVLDVSASTSTPVTSADAVDPPRAGRSSWAIGSLRATAPDRRPAQSTPAEAESAAGRGPDAAGGRRAACTAGSSTQSGRSASAPVGARAAPRRPAPRSRGPAARCPAARGTSAPMSAARPDARRAHRVVARLAARELLGVTWIGVTAQMSRISSVGRGCGDGHAASRRRSGRDVGGVGQGGGDASCTALTAPSSSSQPRSSASSVRLGQRVVGGVAEGVRGVTSMCSAAVRASVRSRGPARSAGQPGCRGRPPPHRHPAAAPTRGSSRGSVEEPRATTGPDIHRGRGRSRRRRACEKSAASRLVPVVRGETGAQRVDLHGDGLLDVVRAGSPTAGSSSASATGWVNEQDACRLKYPSCDVPPLPELVGERRGVERSRVGRPARTAAVPVLRATPAAASRAAASPERLRGPHPGVADRVAVQGRAEVAGDRHTGAGVDGRGDAGRGQAEQPGAAGCCPATPQLPCGCAPGRSLVARPNRAATS